MKKADMKKAVKLLKKIDFKKYFNDENLIKFYGTQLLNRAYELNKLGVLNIINEFLKKYKKIFMEVDDNELNDLEFKNKIYGLTHIVINESDYYQKWASKKKLKWVLDYFYENIDKIIKKTNSDIIAEVGLCFMLCRDKQNKILKKVKDYLVKEFDNNLGYIPRDNKKKLGISEHTNIIAYMVLGGFNKLYKGPNLSKYFK